MIRLNSDPPARAPAAERAKITKHIGWHTFRRTFSTLLKGQRRGHQGGAGTAAARNGEDDAWGLHADGHTSEAECAVKGGSDAEGGGEMKGFLLLDPKWTLENFGKPVSC